MRLQRFAARRTVLKRVALRCAALHCVALRCVALRCTALQHVDFGMTGQQPERKSEIRITTEARSMPMQQLSICLSID
jgi:hypothetical protein